MKTVLIVVTHLLGTGHLTRALNLARAFVQAGHKVHVASGGMPTGAQAAGVMLHQLPPLRSDGTDFTRLLGPEGVADDAYRAGRIQALVALVRDVAPDVLITELFPFGRRNLKAEFEAVLRAVPPKTRIFASVRDILAPPSKPAKAEYAAQIIAQHYDGVLVHADPAVIGLEQSWPVTPELSEKLLYTGFVAPQMPAGGADAGTGEVLVSAGGGAVGDRLFAAALEAAGQEHRQWRLLVGGADTARVARLAAQAPGNTVVEPARRDFREMLMRVAASVSFCGYNTAVDLIQTGVPAIITPFDDGGETEQTQRAVALARLEGVEMVASADVSGVALLRALERVLAAPRRAPSDHGMQGAAETVRICVQ